MIPPLPTYFISHGAPTLPLDHLAPAHQFLSHFGADFEARYGKPKAILVISAHWETQDPCISTTFSPQTIHDFNGFPPALYKLTYPAQGTPEIAHQALEILKKAGFTNASSDEQRGLDHGAWNPLLLMWPQADISVFQLSLQPDYSPAHHLALGRALTPLREQGVLIIGSGAATHNLSEFRGQPADSPAPDWVKEFAGWLQTTIEADDIRTLCQFQKQAHEGLRNHPTVEHLLPLFVSIGAKTDGRPGKAIHRSFRYGVLAMDCYRFG